MKKIVVFFLMTIIWSYGRSQILTDDYAAFEHLIADVRMVVDSCLCRTERDTSSLSLTKYMLEVCLDSNGYICKARQIGKNSPSLETQCICIEHALLSSNKRYNLFIEDYQFLKDRYWELHDYVIYTIPCYACIDVSTKQWSIIK